MTKRWETDPGEIRQLKRRRVLHRLLGALLPDELDLTGGRGSGGQPVDDELREEYERFFQNTVADKAPAAAVRLQEAEAEVHIEIWHHRVYAESRAKDCCVYACFDDACRQLIRLEVDDETVVEESGRG
jgi:hypothetical protein